MAKKRSSKSDNEKVKRVLAELAKNPAALGKFIQDAKKFLRTQKIDGELIPKELWDPIWQAVSRDVMHNLLNAAECYEHH